MLDVMAGPAIGDPSWAAPLPPGESYLGWCAHPPERLRIARFADPPIVEGTVEPAVLAGYERASRLLDELGHEIVDIELPVPEQTVRVFEVVWAVGTATWPIDPAQEQELRPLTQWLRGRGAAVPAPAFASALVAMRQVAATILRTLAPYDAVLTPTLAQVPAPVGGLRDDADPARDFDNQKRFTPFTALWNVTGMPAVSLPLHWSTPSDGEPSLPVGTMLGGRPGDDHLLLALAAQVEDASTFAGRWAHPPTAFTAALP
jgi:amidase